MRVSDFGPQAVLNCYLGLEAVLGHPNAELMP